MAILRGFKVWIEAEGKELPEYAGQDSERARRTIFRYIEVAAGSTYAIKYKFPENFCTKLNIPGYTLRLYVDGKEVDTTINAPDVSEGEFHGRMRYQGASSTLEQFQFAKAKIDERSAVSQRKLEPLERKASELGLIRLDLYRAKACWIDSEGESESETSGSERPKSSSGPPAEHNELIPKKAVTNLIISHRTTFGPKQEGESRETWGTDNIDEPGEPYRRFEFKCLSRDFLRAIGVIPRDGSPTLCRDISPTPTQEAALSIQKCQGKDLTREELIQFFDQHKASQGIIASRGTKRQRDLADNRELSLVVPRKYRRSRAGYELVDLE